MPYSVGSMPAACLWHCILCFVKLCVWWMKPPNSYRKYIEVQICLYICKYIPVYMIGTRVCVCATEKSKQWLWICHAGSVLMIVRQLISSRGELWHEIFIPPACSHLTALAEIIVLIRTNSWVTLNTSLLVNSWHYTDRTRTFPCFILKIFLISAKRKVLFCLPSSLTVK